MSVPFQGYDEPGLNDYYKLGMKILEKQLFKLENETSMICALQAARYVLGDLVAKYGKEYLLENIIPQLKPGTKERAGQSVSIEREILELVDDEDLDIENHGA